MVHGDTFLFSVKEPAGWKADTKDADSWQANVIFHEAGKPADSAAGVIRVRVNDKVSENTAADMAEDEGSYREQFPGVQFRDVAVSCDPYRCLSEIFFVPEKFYEYVTYLNPGAKKPVLISISMNSDKAEATAQELDAYKAVIQSLTVLKP